MLTRLARRIADRSMIVMAAATLCAAGCKKADKPAGGSGSTGSSGSSATGGSTGGGNKIVIGVMSDMSGLYAELAGPGSVVAAQMAVDEMGGKVGDLPIEIISGDHQNKPDVGSNLAREWFDTKNVDVIVDVPTSSVALAITE